MVNRVNDNKNQSKYEVLVVDDNLGDLKLIELALNEIGYENIILTVKGKEALALAEKLRPKYIIADLNLPDINGVLLCRQVKKIKNYNPIVISITGMPESPYFSELACYEHDNTLADRYLTKSNNYHDLQFVLANFN